MLVPPCGALAWGFRIQGWLAGIASTLPGTATWCCSKGPNLWAHLGSNLNSVSSSVMCAYNVCYITLPTKVCLAKAMVFPVVMYGWESCTIKKAEHWKTSFQTTVLEKTLESPLDCKEIQPVNPKGNPSWIVFGRTDAEAKAPIFWIPDARS